MYYRILFVFLLSTLASTVFTMSALHTCERKYSCVNCTTVRLCKPGSDGALVDYFQFACNSDRPYCDAKSGSCRLLPDRTECADTDPELSCPYEGHFPHPTNNTQFYVCLEGRAHLFDCKTRCYDSMSRSCRYPAGSANCNDFNCTHLYNDKVTYGRDRRYFAYCYQGSAYQADRCPGKYVLDVKAQTCVPDCSSSAGYIGDVDDCAKYYVCSKASASPRSSRTYTTHESCPPGQLFDALRLACAPKENNPSCASVLYATKFL